MAGELDALQGVVDGMRRNESARAEGGGGCLCAVCAPSGEDSTCVPWQAPQPCACTAPDGPQRYPAARTSPPCCQSGCLMQAAVKEAPRSDPPTYSEDDVVIHTGGQVDFRWLGLHNVREANADWSLKQTAGKKGEMHVQCREQQIRGSGGSLEPPGPLS